MVWLRNLASARNTDHKTAMWLLLPVPKFEAIGTHGSTKLVLMPTNVSTLPLSAIKSLIKPIEDPPPVLDAPQSCRMTQTAARDVGPGDGLSPPKSISKCVMRRSTT